MVTTRRDKGLRVGDPVEILWGAGPTRGTVIDVYGESSDKSIIVEIPLHDAFGEVIASSTSHIKESEIVRKL